MKKKVQRLLKQKHTNCVTLHAMGAAIRSCCDLALEFKDGPGFGLTERKKIELDVTTGTQDVYDEFIPKHAVS